MAAGKPKKSALDKIIDGVDHFIHPDHVTSDELDSQVEKKKTDKNPTRQIKDLKEHPKFAKFKQEKK